MYVVKFVDIAHKTVREDEYDDLFDAIKVAKETNIGPDRLVIPAMSRKFFNQNFSTLLTIGYVYAGQKTYEFPNGNFIVLLLKRNDEGIETPLMDSSRAFIMPSLHDHRVITEV
jgi:hypothetical protein